VKWVLGYAAAAAIAIALAACSSGNSGGSGGSDTDQIRSRINSLVAHINSGNAKAILDDDVPTSARRTCSDKDAKESLTRLKELTPKLSVKSIDDVTITGSKATASVVLSTGNALLQQTPPIPFPLVKDGGGWRIDTTEANGCNGLVPTGLG